MRNSAEQLTRDLGGNWHNGQGLAPCPLCQPERRTDQRALSVSGKGGRILFYCHKNGCDVFGELRKRGFGDLDKSSTRGGREAEGKEESARQRRRTDYANDVFNSGTSCAETLAQKYLSSRGLDGLRFEHLQRTLRFHPALPHGPSEQSFPAMIARIRNVGGFPIGIHRTYLRHDGSAKADVAPNKMMLGASSGGAVRFGRDAPLIVVAEGIETALSVGLSSRATCWAALSASGLKALQLPPLPVAAVVVVAADHDQPGLEAARILADRLEREGRAASVIKPPQPGQDFNDILRNTQ